jgi:hypothetical protein
MLEKGSDKKDTILEIVDPGSPKTPPPPDLTIRVRRIKTSGTSFEYAYTLISFKEGVNLYYRECKSQRLGEKYQKILHQKFELLNKYTNNQDAKRRANKRLKNLGKDLYRTLFNYEFDAIYWDIIRTQIKTIQVISDEQIPWELIYPVNLRTNEIPDTNFWGERFRIAHWFPGTKPADRIHVRSLDIVRALDDESASREEQYIIQLFTSNRIRHRPLEPRVQPVSEAFSSLRYSILHVICHGSSDPGDGDQSYIKLSDGHIMPDDIEDCADKDGANCLVFLNGCQTAVIGPGLLGLGGWAHRLVTRAGRNIVLGTIWKVPSQSACEFARSFYDALYNRELDSSSGESFTPGHILEAANIARRQSGDDPTRLSYRIYGSPLATIARGGEIDS